MLRAILLHLLGQLVIHVIRDTNGSVFRFSAVSYQ
jgi:hypothetical protein